MNSDMDVNSIFYWWPLVKDLGIPMPKTTLIPYDGDLFLDSHSDSPPEFTELVAQVKAACEEYGYPAFIRCGGLSAKHEWKNTCYLEGPSDIPGHIFNLMEAVLMVMGMRLDFDGIAVREFLHLENRFKAFGGEMPIAKEFRFFARNGEYECHHPYWPPSSIWKPSIDGWYEALKGMQTLTDEELGLLKGYSSKLAIKLDEGELGTGWWSLDFCKTVDGVWYLTDLAVGENSYHWSTCPHSPEDMSQYPDPEDPEKIGEALGPTARAERMRKIRERLDPHRIPEMGEDPEIEF